jgi:hypothetical protein
VSSRYQISVALIHKDQDGENCQMKAKGRLLTIQGLRLPHLKPFAADHHETKEPDEKPQAGADENEPLRTVEPRSIGPQLTK